MNTLPTCGQCGKTMTPANSTRRPELFLCDSCAPEQPCAKCGAKTGHPSGVCVLCQPNWPATRGPTIDDALRRVHELERSNAFKDEVNEKLRQMVDQYGNTFGRIAIALFGDDNNRTDEECINAITEFRREVLTTIDAMHKATQDMETSN